MKVNSNWSMPWIQHYFKNNTHKIQNGHTFNHISQYSKPSFISAILSACVYKYVWVQKHMHSSRSLVILLTNPKDSVKIHLPVWSVYYPQALGGVNPFATLFVDQKSTAVTIPLYHVCRPIVNSPIWLYTFPSVL